jgi:hypothetical protein
MLGLFVNNPRQQTQNERTTLPVPQSRSGPGNLHKLLGGNSASPATSNRIDQGAENDQADKTEEVLPKIWAGMIA